MSLLAWIVFGLIAGVLATMIVPASSNLVVDIVVGIVGAMVGGFLFNAIGQPGVTGFNLWSVLVAVVGAVVLLGCIRLIQSRT